jgi:putative acetyltransferase
MTSKSIREATPTPNQTMTPKSDSSALTVTIDDPNGEVATGLINDLCSELSARYGTPPSPFSPDEALAPGTAFVVARLGGQPIGCGALRRIDEATAEVKRMYVAPDGRRRGIARRILHALEQLAAGFNYRAIRLETGVEQPEAISLYESSGYHRIAAYGHHTGDSLSVCFEKAIPDKTRNA